MNESRILIFAGAGISAESGLSTFRDTNGLWTKYDVNKVCSYSVFKASKDDKDVRYNIFDFYNKIKEQVLLAHPNQAHKTIANWQQKLGVERVKIVTANIDNLFERAGCEEVTHVHGDINNMMCDACSNRWEVDAYDSTLRCPKCNSKLTKPNVVFFGEKAPEYLKMTQIFNPKKRSDNDILLYVGSSMSVIPPSRLILGKGIKVLVNKDFGEEDYLFRHKYYGLATEELLKVEKDLIKK